jgi:hypothetical protein
MCNPYNAIHEICCLKVLTIIECEFMLVFETTSEGDVVYVTLIMLLTRYVV